MLYKASRLAEQVAKSFFDVIIVYILFFKHDDFTGKSGVRFNDETLRFKLEQTREIVHASCFLERKWQYFVCV